MAKATLKNRYAQFNEGQHPRDEGGQFSSKGSGSKGAAKSGGKRAKAKKPSKRSIQEAAGELAAKGYNLIGAEPWHPENKSTSYRVKQPSGDVQVMSANEIEAVISGGQSSSAIQRSRDELAQGLSKWVDEYKTARRANVKLAKQIKTNIEQVIKDKGLDRDTVYGDNPNRHSRRDQPIRYARAAAELDDPSVYPPLDPERFDITHDVPVFDEHEDEEPERDENGHIKRDADGKILRMKKIRYTQDVLESIAENLNQRIRDTGDYTAIAINHTPTPAEKRAGIQPPPVVGFTGPYYVAPFGKENPRPTIHARNWGIFKEHSEEARRYPRRSVELWAEPNLHDRIFDPVSLIGSETPRRDLGLLYSRSRGSVPVFRYSSVYPSGGNTFVPGADDSKERYEQTETEGETMLTDDDVQKLVAAVSEMEEIQYVRQMMQSERAKGDDTPMIPNAEGELDDVPVAGDEPVPATPKERNMEPEGDDDEQHKQYRRQEADKIRYARIEQDNSRLSEENKQLGSRISAIETDNRRVKRYAQVESLSLEYVLDPEEEMKRADVKNDDEWDEHVDLIKTRYQRNPVGRPMLPVAPPSTLPTDQARTEKRNERVRDKIERYTRADVHKSYAEIVAEVDKEMAAA